MITICQDDFCLILRGCRADFMGQQIVTLNQGSLIFVQESGQFKLILADMNLEYLGTKWGTILRHSKNVVSGF